MGLFVSTIVLLLISIVVVASFIVVIKCSKKLLKFEREAFGVVILQILALNWLWKDLGESRVTVFTVLIVVCAVGVTISFIRRYKV